MKHRKVILFAAAALSLTLACNITNVPTGGSTPNVGATPNVGSMPTEVLLPSPTPIPSTPVNLRAGLASLNTYSLVIESNFSGPAQADYSQTHIEIQKSTDLDATSTHYVITQSSESDSEPSMTDSYRYTIGNAKCSGSDEDGWDYTNPPTPQQSEMVELLSEMMDLVPLIDTPTFVGSETMNGIMANHFTFRVSGLGLQSGAEVTANQGDYWLAQDGQYIVKYYLVTETVDTTTQTTLHMDVLIEVTNVNQPVEISFPAGCVQ